MGEYFYARIEIGGPIPRDSLGGLYAAIGAEDLQDEEFEPVRIQAPGDLGKYLVDGLLRFQDRSAYWGMFPDLEHFLRKAGIPYDRCSEGIGEFEGEKVSLRPGMMEPVHKSVDGTGRPYVLRERLTPLLGLEDSNELRRQLSELLGDEVGPLQAIDPSVFSEGG